MQIISQINDNAYTQRVEFRYRDEIGLLGNQINDMYTTIEQQMKQIQLDERDKAQTEIQMISEQINPHFLYNTLQRIHMTMLNGRTPSAASMLEGLGKYLRITLSIGKALIPLREELAHVNEYVLLMDHYFENGLQFTVDVDPLLLNVVVPKIILQPLVENSYKYGFDKGEIFANSVQPAVSISAQTQDGRMLLAITDNGKGFDVPSIQACMDGEAPDGRTHFGLQNLKKRLCGFYAEDVFITFSSIPYYQNSIYIRVPLRGANNTGGEDGHSLLLPM